MTNAFYVTNGKCEINEGSVINATNNVFNIVAGSVTLFGGTISGNLSKGENGYVDVREGATILSETGWPTE